MKRTSLLVLALILMNAITAFILNILANKVSDLLVISNDLLPWITFATICFASALGLILDYRENKVKSLQNIDIISILTSRVITVFLTAVSAGMVTGYICHLLIPIEHGFLFLETVSWLVLPFNYEIIGFIVGVGTLYAVKQARNNTVLSTTYAIGFGVSIGLVLYELYPRTYEFGEVALIPSLIVWCLLLLSVVAIMHTNAVKKFFEILTTTVNFLAKVR